MKTMAIVGAGKVGQVFGRCFQQQNVFSVTQILNRTSASARAARTFIGAGAALANWQELVAADVWMLAVGDDHISDVCNALSERGLINEHTIVFHCSGSKASTELAAAASSGAVVASVHPVRSFADPQAVADHFSGTICSLEGDRRALDVLLPAMQAIGAQTVEISAESKLLYHAGSVFASNYLVSLMDVALRAYQSAGIPPELARAMAQPLARQSLENVFQLGAPAALTGPIARGDMTTVSRQQAVVSQWDQAAGELYQAFVTPTVELATRKHHSEK